MKARLIKTNKSELGYILSIDVATLKGIMPNNYNLSLKNCQAIEHGYDLEELVDEYTEEWKYDSRIGFRNGFQKALEILGDKKFSEEDMKKAYLIGCDKQTTSSYHVEKNIQSLQTEWEVEVEMEDVTVVHPGGDNEIISQPKLDADGCLILRKI